MEHRSLAVDAGVAGTPTPRIGGRRQVIAEALARVCDSVLGTHRVRGGVVSAAAIRALRPYGRGDLLHEYVQVA